MGSEAESVWLDVAAAESVAVPLHERLTLRVRLLKTRRDSLVECDGDNSADCEGVCESGLLVDCDAVCV